MEGINRVSLVRIVNVRNKRVEELLERIAVALEKQLPPEIDFKVMDISDVVNENEKDESEGLKEVDEEG